jgi:peptidoglycan/xylan/chitin deacetylase (PgdA/CDA1 family)
VREMRLSTAGLIATVFVILVGVVMVVPIFFSDARANDRLQVVLIFEIGDPATADWCQSISKLLSRENVRATVFFSGEFAHIYPESVSGFSKGVDIGSQTLTYANLTTIDDYSIQLKEVIEGKAAVDKAGNLDSKLFRAPYGSTDENIYSLLNRANILTDFSYSDHYNKYSNGQFIRMEIPIYDLLKTESSYIKKLIKQNDVDKILVLINDTNSIEKITDLVLSLKSGNFQLINASDLAQLELTIRK